MSGSGERALLQLNLRRDTWCQVEVNPRQAWDRTQRKHHRGHLRTSPALLAAMTRGGPPPGGARRDPPPPARLPERRHFEESYKSHLV